MLGVLGGGSPEAWPTADLGRYLLTYQAQARYLSCLYPEEAAATTAWDQMA